jgi:hypothetical protein
MGIACSDGEDLTDHTRDDLYDTWQTLESQSRTLGGYWTHISMSCANWPLRATWKFEKPKIAADHTAHPLLWLSNTRDPVTPLRNARKMAARFPGSIVFGQNADGHCTLAQASRCVAKGVREYFQTGKLPEGDIGCVPDRGLFEPEQLGESILSTEEAELSRAASEISKVIREKDLPLGI